MSSMQDAWTGYNLTCDILRSTSQVFLLCYGSKASFGSPRDEEVLDGYVECDLLNNTSPGVGVSFNHTARSIRGRAVFRSLQATYTVYSRARSIRRALNIRGNTVVGFCVV